MPSVGLVIGVTTLAIMVGAGISLGVFIYNNFQTQESNRNNNTVRTQPPTRSEGTRRRKRNGRNSTEEYDNCCSVCYDTAVGGKCKLLCGHTFHISCINEHLKHQPRCPVCRGYVK